MTVVYTQLYLTIDDDSLANEPRLRNDDEEWLAWEDEREKDVGDSVTDAINGKENGQQEMKTKELENKDGTCIDKPAQSVGSSVNRRLVDEQNHWPVCKDRCVSTIYCNDIEIKHEQSAPRSANINIKMYGLSFFPFHSLLFAPHSLARLLIYVLSPVIFIFFPYFLSWFTIPEFFEGRIPFFAETAFVLSSVSHNTRELISFHW